MRDMCQCLTMQTKWWDHKHLAYIILLRENCIKRFFLVRPPSPNSDRILDPFLHIVINMIYFFNFQFKICRTNNVKAQLPKRYRPQHRAKTQHHRTKRRNGAEASSSERICKCLRCRWVADFNCKSYTNHSRFPLSMLHAKEKSGL